MTTKLTPAERIHRDRIAHFLIFRADMVDFHRRHLPLKIAQEPLLTDEQKYFAEYLPTCPLDAWRAGLLHCPKCDCACPECVGGDTIISVREPMYQHISFWKCLNPDCLEWWSRIDDDEDDNYDDS